jgi:hypothetical protein
VTTVHLHDVRAVTAGAIAPVYRDGEAIGSSRRVEIWTHDGLVELVLHADEAAVLAFPSDPVERQQLHFARADLAIYRNALEAIAGGKGNPVAVATEAIGED